MLRGSTSLTKCFRTAIRCGEPFPPDCPYFKTIAEETIFNSLEKLDPKTYAPRIFIIVARQGTGKSALATYLYDNILKKLNNIIPVLICGREDLASIFVQEITSKLNYTLSRWLEYHKNVRKSIDKDLDTLSIIMDICDLMPFIIIDEAHLVNNLDGLMSKIRSLESSLKLAGVMLLFQDLNEEQEKRILFQLHERGGSRFVWMKLSTNDLIPVGEEVERIYKWVKSIIIDEIASRTYTEIASTFGFRAANHFALAFIEPKGGGNLSKMSAAVVDVLASKYNVPKEVVTDTSSHRVRADIYISGIPIDVKICSDTQSLKRAIEDDKKKGYMPVYVVVGNCDTSGLGVKAISIPTDAPSLAYAIEIAAYNIGINAEVLFRKLGEVIAEYVDFSSLGVQKPRQEELIVKLASELCEEIGEEGVTRSDLIRKSHAKKLASIFSIPLSKADDVSKFLQELQRRQLPFRFISVGRKVKCIKQQVAIQGDKPHF